LVKLRDKRLGLLLIWVGSTLVVGGVLTIEPPYAPRLVVLIPAVCILIALGLVKTTELVRSYSGLATAWGLLLAFAAAGLMMVADARFYFEEYAPKAYFSDANTEVATLAGRYIAEHGDGYRVYLLGAPRLFVSHTSLTYLACEQCLTGADVGVDIVDPLVPGVRPVQVQGDSRLLFIFVPERLRDLDNVRRSFPGGKVLEFGGRFANRLFVIYRVD
ncbi:MAG: hypothetical protein ACYC7H_09090, partial [Chloroflexota bacterium]